MAITPIPEITVVPSRADDGATFSQNSDTNLKQLQAAIPAMNAQASEVNDLVQAALDAGLEDAADNAAAAVAAKNQAATDAGAVATNKTLTEGYKNSAAADAATAQAAAEVAGAVTRSSKALLASAITVADIGKNGIAGTDESNNGYRTMYDIISDGGSGAQLDESSKRAIDPDALADELNTAASGKGSDKVVFPESITSAVPYLQTLSDMLNGLPVSVFRFISRTKHAGIKARTNTDDLAPSINLAFDALFTDYLGGEFILPFGMYNIEQSIVPKAGVKMRGLGHNQVNQKPVLIVPSAAVTKAIAIANLRGVGLEGVCIDMSAMADGSSGIEAAGFWFSTLRNLWIINVSGANSYGFYGKIGAEGNQWNLFEQLVVFGDGTATGIAQTRDGGTTEGMNQTLYNMCRTNNMYRGWWFKDVGGGHIAQCCTSEINTIALQVDDVNDVNGCPVWYGGEIAGQIIGRVRVENAPTPIATLDADVYSETWRNNTIYKTTTRQIGRVSYDDDPVAVTVPASTPTVILTGPGGSQRYFSAFLIIQADRAPSSSANCGSAIYHIFSGHSGDYNLSLINAINGGIDITAMTLSWAADQLTVTHALASDVTFRCRIVGIYNAPPVFTFA